MWVVDPPTLTAGEAAEACAKGIRETGLKARVKSAVASFAANSVTLQDQIHAQLLHQATSTGYVVSGLSNDELRWLYDRQVLRLRSRARHVYDHVKGNALHELCSYCQYGVANTIDHFVPIAEVHALSIDPWNLVPACGRCNQLLLDKFDPTPQGQMLHPYAVPASMPPTCRWLRATVVVGSAPILRFYADPDASATGLVRQRIINQFAVLELDDLYRQVSGRELSGACRTIEDRFAGKPSQLVRSHLKEVSDLAFADDPNDRRGAMYEALATSAWFTTTGYRLLL